MSLGPIMMGVAGCGLSAEERELLQQPQVGGVILFSRNYESPAQVAALTAEIHARRDPPLLIAVDQEGGRVQRFRTGFTLLPAVARLGELYDIDPARARQYAEATGWLMAAELRSVGVDLSFAPVLDLARGVSQVIGDRAFHRDATVVAELAHSYVRGMRRAGMVATGKHFPGHGSVAQDSHLELPVDPRPYRELESEDLLAFRRMVGHGIEALMTAHVVYRDIDPAPATFSRFWLQEVLRRRCGFQGVIFSDDLHMGGAEAIGDMAARARAALDAGCDMLLVCHGAEPVARLVEALAQWNNPVSQLRLVRMHGRGGGGYEELRRSPQWREAVRIVGSYDEPHTLELM
ncbi:MAG: beta-N-acetylhexosaminidase [Gammaproteobacteria bacterium]